MTQLSPSPFITYSPELRHLQTCHYLILTACMSCSCMQCCGYIRILRIFGVQSEPEIDGGLLHDLRILRGGTELEPLLGEPLLPRGSITRYIASCGTLKSLGSLIPLKDFFCKNLTMHGDTGGHLRQETSSAGQKTVSAVF